MKLSKNGKWAIGIAGVLAFLGIPSGYIVKKYFIGQKSLLNQLDNTVTNGVKITLNKPIKEVALNTKVQLRFIYKGGTGGSNSSVSKTYQDENGKTIAITVIDTQLFNMVTEKRTDFVLKYIIF